MLYIPIQIIMNYYVGILPLKIHMKDLADRLFPRMWHLFAHPYLEIKKKKKKPDL